MHYKGPMVLFYLCQTYQNIEHIYILVLVLHGDILVCTLILIASVADNNWCRSQSIGVGWSFSARSCLEASWYTGLSW